MRTWTRLLASGLAVAGLSGVLLAVGAASGAPTVPPADAPVALPADGTLLASIAALQDEVRRVPANDRAWADLGLAAVEQSRLSGDPGWYAQADRALDESLRLRPDGNDRALTGRAALAAARHDFADALTLADRALALNPFAAGALAARTDALVELGRYDEARAAVEQLLRLRPGIDAFARASYVLELEGDVEGARAALEQAATTAGSPQDVAFAQTYLGELAWSNGDLDGARRAWSAAVEAVSAHVPAMTGLARARAATGDAAGAVEDLRALASRDPRPEVLVALGELLEAEGQQAEAEEQYALVRAARRLAADGGQDVDTELAVFEADHGDPALAVESARRAYDRRPDSVFTQDALAWALHAAGRSEEALPLARAATRTGLRLPQLHAHLGTVAAAAGQPDEARAALRRALELNPAWSPLHAPEARRLLDRLG